MSERLLLGRDPAGTGRGEVGPVQVDERRRELELHPQRLGERGRAAPAISPSSTTAATCSPRGVRHVALDPSNPEIVYAGSYARGIWRSPDGGATWTQIKPSLNAAIIQTRPAFDVTALPNGKTRMYVYEGNTGTPYSRLFRSDDVATGAPVFTDLTSAEPGRSRLRDVRTCAPASAGTTLFVHTPDGHPDIVYAGGSYSYGENIANKRGVVLSTDAGVSGTDMTFDGTDIATPERAPPRPARHRHQPEQPVPVLRDERRRRDALERQLGGPLGVVRRSAPRA